MLSRTPDRVAWAVEQLAAAPADRILEVGCGAGHAVALLCARVARGTITAIDRSALQVAKARERTHSCIASGRARVEQVTLADAPEVFGGATFSKVFAINVNAFWTDPATSIASLSGLLRAAGRGYLFYEPPSAAALAKLRAAMPKLLEARSFVVEAVRLADSRSSRTFCIVFRHAR
ncbi:MAG TPA: class I SAM-dependent methyltransferase [Polyangiaceae bacterium]|nr:class I SAM-dependent methyltransferase [Polyangiaceae bacterium]